MLNLFGTAKSAITNLPYMLGEIFDAERVRSVYDGKYEGIAVIMDFLNDFLVPITIGLLALGVLLAIVMGIQIAKSDPAKANDAKSRLFGILVGFICFIFAIWIGSAILYSIPDIVEFLKSSLSLGEGWQDVPSIISGV